MSSDERKKGEPPAGITTRRISDAEMRISIPRRGPWPWWSQYVSLFLGGSFVSLIWLSLLSSFLQSFDGSPFALVPLGIFSLLMWAVALRFMKLLSASTSHGTIAIVDDRLIIELATVFRRRLYEWHTERIIGVVSRHHLEIETDDSICQLTTVRSPEENDWAAHLLRKELGLQAGTPDT